MKKCNTCGHDHDESVVIPSPIPDKMCAECGTVLTDEEIKNLAPPAPPQLAPEQTQQFVP